MAKGTWESYFDAMKKQDWEGAKQALLTLAQTEKKNPQVHLKIGDVNQRLGLNTDAISAYHHAAALLSADGFFQKAAALYKIILRIDPDDNQAKSLSLKLIEELDAAKASHAVPVKTEPQEPPPPPVFEDEPMKETPIPAFFSRLPEQDARSFLAGLAVRTFDDGQTVIEEGDSGESMYLVISGNARIITHLLGREIDLGTLAEGDLFGEVSFLSGRPRTASVIASGPLTAYEIGRFDLESLVALDPEVLSTLEEFRQSRARDTISRAKEALS